MAFHGKLVIIKKSGKDGSAFVLSADSCTVGRSFDNDIRIQHQSISRQHCRLDVQPDGQVTIKRLGQSHLKLNNEPTEEATLKHLDVINVGDRLIRWESVSSAVDVEKENAKNSSAKKRRTSLKKDLIVFSDSEQDQQDDDDCESKKENVIESNSEAKKCHVIKVKKTDEESDLGSSTPQRSNQQVQSLRAAVLSARKKRVSFGPKLIPEEFSENLPPSTPLRKGEVPPKTPLNRSVVFSKSLVRNLSQMDVTSESSDQSSAVCDEATPKRRRSGRLSNEGIDQNLEVTTEEDVSTAVVRSPKSSERRRSERLLNSSLEETDNKEELPSKKDVKRRKLKKVNLISSLLHKRGVARYGKVAMKSKMIKKLPMIKKKLKLKKQIKQNEAVGVVCKEFLQDQGKTEEVSSGRVEEPFHEESVEGEVPLETPVEIADLLTKPLDVSTKVITAQMDEDAEMVARPLNECVKVDTEPSSALTTPRQKRLSASASKKKRASAAKESSPQVLVDNNVEISSQDMDCAVEVSDSKDELEESDQSTNLFSDDSKIEDLGDDSAFQTPEISQHMFVSPLTEKKSERTSSSARIRSWQKKHDLDDLKSGMQATPLSKSTSKKAEKSASAKKQTRSSSIKSVKLELSPDDVLEVSGSTDSDGPDSVVKVKSASSKRSSIQSKSAKKRLRSVGSPSPAIPSLEQVKQKLFSSPTLVEAEDANKTEDTNNTNVTLEAGLPQSPKEEPATSKNMEKNLESKFTSEVGAKVDSSPKTENATIDGVRKLLKPRTPPQADYSNVEGIKEVMKPKTPSANYTAVEGVRRLLKPRTPKADFRNVQGIKRLFGAQNNPGYTEIEGVKKLLQPGTPKPDYTNTEGVKQLLHVAVSPDYTNVDGVKRLMAKSNSPNYTTVESMELIFQQASPSNTTVDKKQAEDDPEIASVKSPCLEKAAEVAADCEGSNEVVSFVEDSFTESDFNASVSSKSSDLPEVNNKSVLDVAETSTSGDDELLEKDEDLRLHMEEDSFTGEEKKIDIAETSLPEEFSVVEDKPAEVTCELPRRRSNRHKSTSNNVSINENVCSITNSEEQKLVDVQEPDDVEMAVENVVKLPQIQGDVGHDNITKEDEMTQMDEEEIANSSSTAVSSLNIENLPAVVKNNNDEMQTEQQLLENIDVQTESPKETAIENEIAFSAKKIGLVRKTLTQSFINETDVASSPKRSTRRRKTVEKSPSLTSPTISTEVTNDSEINVLSKSRIDEQETELTSSEDVHEPASEPADDEVGKMSLKLKAESQENNDNVVDDDMEPEATIAEKTSGSDLPEIMSKETEVDSADAEDLVCEKTPVSAAVQAESPKQNDIEAKIAVSAKKTGRGRKTLAMIFSETDVPSSPKRSTRRRKTVEKSPGLTSPTVSTEATNASDINVLSKSKIDEQETELTSSEDVHELASEPADDEVGKMSLKSKAESQENNDNVVDDDMEPEATIAEKTSGSDLPEIMSKETEVDSADAEDLVCEKTPFSAAVQAESPKQNDIEAKIAVSAKKTGRCRKTLAMIFSETDVPSSPKRSTRRRKTVEKSPSLTSPTVSTEATNASDINVAPKSRIDEQEIEMTSSEDAHGLFSEPADEAGKMSVKSEAESQEDNVVDDMEPEATVAEKTSISDLPELISEETEVVDEVLVESEPNAVSKSTSCQQKENLGDSEDVHTSTPELVDANHSSVETKAEIQENSSDIVDDSAADAEDLVCEKTFDSPDVQAMLSTKIALSIKKTGRGRKVLAKIVANEVASSPKRSTRRRKAVENLPTPTTVSTETPNASEINVLSETKIGEKEADLSNSKDVLVSASEPAEVIGNMSVKTEAEPQEQMDKVVNGDVETEKAVAEKPSNLDLPEVASNETEAVDELLVASKTKVVSKRTRRQQKKKLESSEDVHSSTSEAVNVAHSSAETMAENQQEYSSEVVDDSTELEDLVSQDMECNDKDILNEHPVAVELKELPKRGKRQQKRKLASSEVETESTSELADANRTSIKNEAQPDSEEADSNLESESVADKKPPVKVTRKRRAALNSQKSKDEDQVSSSVASNGDSESELTKKRGRSTRGQKLAPSLDEDQVSSTVASNGNSKSELTNKRGRSTRGQKLASSPAVAQPKRQTRGKNKLDNSANVDNNSHSPSGSECDSMVEKPDVASKLETPKRATRRSARSVTKELVNVEKNLPSPSGSESDASNATDNSDVSSKFSTPRRGARRGRKPKEDNDSATKSNGRSKKTQPIDMDEETPIKYAPNLTPIVELPTPSTEVKNKRKRNASKAPEESSAAPISEKQTETKRRKKKSPIAAETPVEAVETNESVGTRRSMRTRSKK